MFKKPFTAKPSAPLRSSERRALIAQLTQDFGIGAELAKSLVPDGLMNGKAETHLEEPCTIYADPVSNDPLFVRRGKGSDGVFFPTIYTLLKAPTLLPLLATPSFVIDKLKDGADLFCGGLSPASLAALPDLKEGSLVAIASIDAPDVPRAIGQLARDSRRLRQDAEGKAVLTLHAHKDYLWNAGSKTEPTNVLPTAESLKSEGHATTVAANNGHENAASVPEHAELSASSLSAKDVDAILRTALLLAIKQTLAKDAKAFPMPASSLWSTHVLPRRPADVSVDIKQSSFKKLTAFLKAAQKEGLLTMKETKADVLVTAVKADHPDVIAQKTYKTIGDAAKQSAGQSEDTTTEVQNKKEIKVKELYAPHGPSLSFWTTQSKSGDDLLTMQDIRAGLNAYITQHDLAYKADAKYFKPDTVLDELLPDRGDADAGAVQRSVAIEALIDGMQRWHLLEIEGEKPVTKKGPGPRIELTVKHRMGPRVVTIITGLEAFKLDPYEIAASLQTLCASSTSVNALPRSTAKKPLHEATVQGDQTAKCMTYLIEQRGVPKAQIDIVPLKRK